MYGEHGGGQGKGEECTLCPSSLNEFSSCNFPGQYLAQIITLNSRPKFGLQSHGVSLHRKARQ